MQRGVSFTQPFIKFYSIPHHINRMYRKFIEKNQFIEGYMIKRHMHNGSFQSSL